MTSSLIVSPAPIVQVEVSGGMKYTAVTRCELSPGYECRVEFHQNTLTSGSNIVLKPGPLADSSATLAVALQVPPGAYGLAYQPPTRALALGFFGVFCQGGAQVMQPLMKRMGVDLDDALYKFAAPQLR